MFECSGDICSVLQGASRATGLADWRVTTLGGCHEPHPRRQCPRFLGGARVRGVQAEAAHLRRRARRDRRDRVRRHGAGRLGVHADRSGGAAGRSSTGADLALLGAFVPVLLRDPDALAPGSSTRCAWRGCWPPSCGEGDRRNGPFIVVADDNATDPVRTLHAGRITPEMALPDEEWAGYAGRAEAVARAVREETGLRSVFHPHSAGWVETPAETDRFLAETDPAVIGIVFDTGHYLFGAGGEGPSVVEAWTAGGIASGTSISRTSTGAGPPLARGGMGLLPGDTRRAFSPNWARAMSTFPRSCNGCATTATMAGSSSSRTCCRGWARPKRARGAIGSIWRRWVFSPSFGIRSIRQRGAA